MTAAPAAALQPDLVANVAVLHERRLRPGTVIEETSRFADEIWRLEPAILQQHQCALALDFTTLPVRWRPVVKELCLATLSGPLPPGETRLSIDSTYRLFTELKRFFAWLDTRTPAPGRPLIPTLAELTGADLEDFQRHLLAVLANPSARYSTRRAVRFLWRYRHNLDCDGLSFDPRHVDGWGEVDGRGRAENATDRIPEAVLGPMVAWSVRFIDDFAPDILAVDQHRRILRDPARLGRPGVGTGAAAALRRLLDEHLAQRRPLPGHRGRPNMHHLAATLGCHSKTLARYRPEIDAAAAVVGISAHSTFDVPITGRLDGQPWIDAIATDHRIDQGLATLARLLQTACYVLVAYLSGMRDSEIKHLRRDCVRVERDADGRPYRWRVQSLAFKGERDPSGVPATWVIGQTAARAISVLERLQPPETDLLFKCLPQGPGTGPASGATNAAMASATTNDQLNAMADWINDYCAAHGRTDGIPAVSGRRWRIKTSQFRRTLAWFIARRPGGTIAGAIHYRHLSIQMFEGYAGTSDSGFRAEVESEQALARGEHLLGMIDAHEHTELAGPAASEAARRLEAFDDQSRFQGTVVTDRHRLRRLMQRQDPAVYPGTYVTCIHDQAKALCTHAQDSSGKLHPDLAGCRPFQCRNVTLTLSNVVAWKAEIEHIERRLSGRPPLPPLLHHRLIVRRDEIIGFLARHLEDHP